MSQLAADGPTQPSSKATLGGLIKSSLVYALVSIIPPAKPGGTVLRPRAGAGAPQSDRASPRIKQEDRAAQDGRGRHASAPWQIPWAAGKTFCGVLMPVLGMIGWERLPFCWTP